MFSTSKIEEIVNCSSIIRFVQELSATMLGEKVLRIDKMHTITIVRRP